VQRSWKKATMAGKPKTQVCSNAKRWLGKE
jgi:hypothetical protein